ncbi:RrF2 family transcriptional regulator [Asticcacaulis sp. AC460]|uniref:RrF2 family transcriptional regulator n=1 Tax=Asticcacaulis sp. AC460 TaxID=1282360 RepID=UPI00040D57DB|nr:Rrf2 family transcriptional regulator [Asticcacaulis sp. AC460]
MLSMKAKYALKALIHMAQSTSPTLPSKQIAEAEDIPQKFLDNILQELRQNGIVDSKRGIFGGYFLARPASEIFLGDVIRVIDGPLAPIRCASLTAYQKCDDCRDEATCHLRRLMRDVRDAMSAILDGRCLQDLVTAPDLLDARSA